MPAHVVENLITDFLNDAGDRLKKSKMNGGVRQVKQTLRFGRRSDPWVSHYEQAAIDPWTSNVRQRFFDLAN